MPPKSNQKRVHSPDNKRAQKRARVSPAPDVIVIDDDGDDEELVKVLARIEEQEKSEKLAKELSQQWNGQGVFTESEALKGGASSSSLDVNTVDQDEALARRLQKEWEEEDRLDTVQTTSLLQPRP
jgi:hypothetical protein